LGDAKLIRVAPVDRKTADAAVKRWHYSGKVVNYSQLHLGVWMGGELLGAMQFGPSMDKRKLQGLVEGTPWNGFIELNRMAFSDKLPRNSESRAIAVAMRMFRTLAPHIQWVVSFADGTQCGDGAIYRASGFALTGIKRNTSLWRAPFGDVVSDVGVRTSERLRRTLHTNGSRASMESAGMSRLEGFQLRYVYFVDPTARGRLTVPVLPFSAIDAAGARMYRGSKILRAVTSTPPGAPERVGGATPTTALHS